MKHATRMAMTWHAMKNPDKRGVQRHHGSDPADMPNTSMPGLFVCLSDFISTRYFFKTRTKTTRYFFWIVQVSWPFRVLEPQYRFANLNCG